MCVRARWYKSQPENIIQIDHTDHTEKQNIIQSLADHTDSTLEHIKVCAKINHSDATLAKVCEQDLSRSCRMHPGKRNVCVCQSKFYPGTAYRGTHPYMCGKNKFHRIDFRTRRGTSLLPPAEIIFVLPQSHSSCCLRHLPCLCVCFASAPRHCVLVELGSVCMRA